MTVPLGGDPFAGASPLAGLAPIAAAIRCGGALVMEQPFTWKIHLRGSLQDADFVAAAEETLGCSLPKPGRRSVGDDIWVLGPAPGEWLVVVPSDYDLGAVMMGLYRALAGTAHGLSEISDSQTVISAAGAGAAALLARICPFDLHPSRLGPGRCTLTRAAGVRVLLHQLDAEPAFDLHVQRSRAAQLWRALTDLPLGGQG